MKRLPIVLGLALLTAGTVASAQTTTTGQQGFGGERPHGPPPEIVAACSGKPTGTQVSVTFRDGKSRTITCGEHHHHGEGQGQAGAPAR